MTHRERSPEGDRTEDRCAALIAQWEADRRDVVVPADFGKRVMDAIANETIERGAPRAVAHRHWSRKTVVAALSFAACASLIGLAHAGLVGALLCLMAGAAN